METRNCRLSKVISIALMFVVAIVGIVIQIFSTVQANKEKEVRNVLFAEQKEENLEVNSELINNVSENEEPEEDVEPQIYVEDGIQNVEIYFVAPEVFYDDLFTTAAYGRVLTEINSYFMGEGMNIHGALIVDKESIEKNDNTVIFRATAEEKPDIELQVVYEKETDKFRFEMKLD